METRLLIDRRQFVKITAAGLAGWPLHASASLAGDTLYNGITLPSPWPPRRRFADDYPVTPPYLTDPPDVIPIDVGRQLFVDDFLIERTTLSRSFHHAQYHPANPVLRPEAEWERRDEAADRMKRPPNPTAMPFSDGVFFDPEDGLFKIWYMGGYGQFTCLATSKDGVGWQRPALDYHPGSNIVMRATRDSGTVWLDHFAPNRAERFKMALFHDRELSLHVAPDGIHWKRIGETGIAGDRTTFFYNPFRHVWVFGIRASQFENTGRLRRYWEHPRFEMARNWGGVEPVTWIKADARDIARREMASTAELYNLDCVAYESVLLGLFTIWRGESSAREKINEVVIGYSRDGFHWHRPDRRSFAGVSDTQGSWNWANVQSAGGGCLVVGDRLYFYVSGRQGRPGTNEPGECSTGLATQRRDGFASMDWLPDATGSVRRVFPGNPHDGALVTRPLRFRGRYLFVNADASGGELRVEMLDRKGQPIAALSCDACVPIRENGTRIPVRWSGGADLARAAGEAVRLRFSLTRGRLYSFWVSPWPSGESRGYVAAGGPGFSGAADTR